MSEVPAGSLAVFGAAEAGVRIPYDYIRSDTAKEHEQTPKEEHLHRQVRHIQA